MNQLKNVNVIVFLCDIFFGGMVLNLSIHVATDLSLASLQLLRNPPSGYTIMPFLFGREMKFVFKCTFSC